MERKICLTSDDLDGLKATIKSLPMVDKYRVLNFVKNLVTGQERADEVKAVSEWYIGTMEGIIQERLDESRTTAQVYARVVLAAHLYERGFSVIEIGKVLDRDHSTITHYRRMYADAVRYPKSYGLLMKLDKVFLKRIEEQ